MYSKKQAEIAFRRTVLDYPASEVDEKWQQNEFPKLLNYFLAQLEVAKKEEK